MAPRSRSQALLAFLALVAIGSARAQSPTEPRPARSPSAAPHAWLVMPDADSGESVLIHVPPRRAHEGAISKASEPGTIRVARRLATPPRDLGAWGAHVYLLMPAAPPTPARVLTLRAAPTPIADFWSYQPSERLESLGPLPDGFTGESVAGTAHGAVVMGLLDGERVVLRHQGGGWSPIDFGPLLPSDQLLGGRDPGVLRLGESGQGSLLTPDPEQQMSSRPVLMPALGVVLDARLVGSRVIVALGTGDAIDVVAISESEPEHIAAIAEVSGARGVAMSGGRAESLVVVHALDGDAPKRFGVIEVSTATGAEIYRGPARNTVPLSANRFRLLALVLIGLTALLLLLTIRAGADQAVLLPDGFALAEPSRRFTATCIDALIAAFIVSVAFGVPLLDLITLRILFGSGDAWMLVPAVMATGFALGVAGESVSGRTLGKLLTGCRVVRVARPDSDGARVAPGLARSAVRNLLKWGLPPVTILALVDPSARSRADVVSGLVVVVPTQPPPGE